MQVNNDQKHGLKTYDPNFNMQRSISNFCQGTLPDCKRTVASKPTPPVTNQI